MTNREQPADFEAWYAEQYESPQWSHCKNAMHDAWDAAALASQGAPKAEAPADRLTQAESLIERFGRGVTDMFEQMTKGNWRDDFGHDVRVNKAMSDLMPLVEDAIAYRAALAHAQRPAPDPDVARLRRIAVLIGTIFCYGDFKAETFNERELEKLLRENGTFWSSIAECDAWHAAQRPAGPATPDLRAALAEPVACKELHDRCENMPSDPDDPAEPDATAMWQEYRRRKPLAWEAARAALAAQPARAEAPDTEARREQIARAIYEADGSGGWEVMHQSTHNHHKRAADAVLRILDEGKS